MIERNVENVYFILSMYIFFSFSVIVFFLCLIISLIMNFVCMKLQYGAARGRVPVNYCR